MTIDTKMISRFPFANLAGISQHNDEEKIFLSTHTVFRMTDIKQRDDNNRFWHVKLTLTDDNDKQLCDVTKKIREETQDRSTGLNRLGKLLIRLRDYDKAKELCRI